MKVGRNNKQSKILKKTCPLKKDKNKDMMGL
jgi:hypothetical protein